MYKSVGILLGSIFLLFMIFLDGHYTALDWYAGRQREANIYCQSVRPDLPPKSFSSDGCSLFLESAGSYNWKSCCVTHDLAYWCGGPKALKGVADKELQTCGNKVIPGLGLVLRIGSVIGGQSFLPTSWRWGYGWEYPDY